MIGSEPTGEVMRGKASSVKSVTKHWLSGLIAFILTAAGALLLYCIVFHMNYPHHVDFGVGVGLFGLAASLVVGVPAVLLVCRNKLSGTWALVPVAIIAFSVSAMNFIPNCNCTGG